MGRPQLSHDWRLTSTHTIFVPEHYDQAMKDVLIDLRDNTAIVLFLSYCEHDVRSENYLLA